MNGQDAKDSIIIVDDDEMFLELLETWFLRLGYRCEKAKDAESALALVKNTPFDIMLADINMPGMTGFELTERSKALRADMVIIIMTGFVDDFSYDNAMEAGASDFIKKPFTFKELTARIKQARMQEELRALSLTDELTGLYNRRGFFTLATYQLKMAKRLDRGIYMLYADLDDLKWINDTFGHKEGDEALIETSTILKENYRESDIVARMGGDEFAVIPVGTAGDHVDKIVDRLHEKLAELNARPERKYGLSISAGIGFFDPKSPCSLEELVAQADSAMYEQKRRKRVRPQTL